MADKLTYQVDGKVGRIKLDRPEQRNCFDIEMMEQWLEAIRTFEADSNVKVVAISGAGENFSAGADLSMVLSAVETGDRKKLQRFIDSIHEVTLALERLPVPTLAAIQGYALAGGLEILLACDLRIATENATIGDQHANYGLVAGGGGTQRLIRQIETCKANEIMYLGRHLSGTEAAEWGIVNHAVPTDEFDAVVRKFETELSTKSRQASGLTKDLLFQGQQLDKVAGLDLERRSVVEHYFSEDAVEGVRAFNEGRNPEF